MITLPGISGPRPTQHTSVMLILTLLSIAVLLITSLPSVQPLPTPVVPALPEHLSTDHPSPSLPATPAAPVYPLPPELVGKSEIVQARTANSATFDMGDGRYAVINDSTPLHYQDKDGAWQPINPAFEAIEEGWINRTNSVQTGIAPTSSVAKINVGGSGTGWEPISLLAADRVVATALSATQAAPGVRSKDGATVRYQHSWSDSSLQDQWQIRPGSSEYTMRLARLPVTNTLPPQNLDLQVTLHLMPGTTIRIAGKQIALPLETQQPLEFTSANGSVFILQPPTTYEQNNPQKRIAGSYILAGTDNPTAIDLRVRTPWSWLAASTRQFPVIIDPRFQIKNPLTADTFFFSNDRTKPGEIRNFTNARLELGQFNDGVQQLLVNMALPALPPNNVLDKAYIIATPTDVSFTNRDYLAANVLAYDYFYDLGNTTNPALDPNPISPYSSGPNPFHLTPLPPGSQAMRSSRGAPSYSSTTWDVTSLVQKWRNDNTDLHNILFRTENQFCRPDPNGCGSFYFDNPPSWNEGPGGNLDVTERDSSFDHAATLASRKGGIRLLVFYTGPELRPYQSRSNPDDELKNTGVPYPGVNPPYYHADHEYRITQPLHDGKWHAVVVRGFDKVTGTPDSIELGKITYQRNITGSVSTELRSNNDQQLLKQSSGTQGGVNYILLDGNNPQLDVTPRVRVKPNDGGEPPTSTGYDLQLMTELGTIANNNQQPIPQSGVSTVLTYTFDTANPLALWNVLMPTNSRSRVDIDVFDNLVTNNPQYPLPDNRLLFNAQLIGTSSGIYSTQQDKRQDFSSGSFSHLTSSIFTPTDSRYALAVSYRGPLLQANNPDPPIIIHSIPTSSQAILPSDIGLSSNSAINVRQQFTLQIRVTSCGTDDQGNSAFPTASGTCQVVKCPTSVSFPSNSTNFSVQHGIGLWSEAGWETTFGDQVSVSGVAPLVGPADRTAPTAAIIGGLLSYGTEPGAGVKVYISNPFLVRELGSQLSDIILIQCGDPQNATNPLINYSNPGVFRGSMQSVANTSDTNGNYFQAVSDPLSTPINPWSINDRHDLSNQSFRIYPTPGLAQGVAVLSRKTSENPKKASDNPKDPANPIITLRFETSWSVTVNGWPSFASTVKLVSGTPPSIASLNLALGDTFAFDVSMDTPYTFGALRASKGTITQPTDLGGASKPIQVLISPDGGGLPGDDGNASYANISWIDLRALDDTATQPNRLWSMPDVHTRFPAGMVMIQQQGAVQVYSIDHPKATTQATPPEFSYDAYGSSVSVKQETCTDKDTNKVTVIKGETQMKLPNIGGASPDAAISASFKICETSLRQVHMEFHSPVGIPVGNSGLFVTGLQGTVDIYPGQGTTIKFGLDFQAASGGDGGLFKGHGDVTIDTRGLFAFQGSAKILGTIDASGKLWAAWNPLDIGFEMDLSYGGWFKGMARAHMWKGQGWQGRYAWLPNNNDTHIAAQIAATITIEKGDIFSFAFIDIPPSDIDFHIEVAFGQFCTSDDCHSYEWGVKGKFSIAGYDIGLYYGFDHGFDFILGNDGHVLVDQYGGAQSSPLMVASSRTSGTSSTDVRPAASVINGVATEPFTITEQADQVLIGLGWRAGAPELRLIAPDNTILPIGLTTNSNSASSSVQYSVEVSSTANMRLVGLKRPSNGAWAGIWHAEIGNLSNDPFFEDYKFIEFANHGAPGATSYTFTAPTTQNTPPQTDGMYNITWRVPPEAESATQATISLFYTTTAITGNLGLRVPIRYHIPFKNRQYQWDTRGLASGAYQIVAEVDDGVNDLPNSAISQPDNTCVPLNSELPHARAFDSARFPGTAIFTATGTIQITDNTPPPTPSNVTLTPDANAVLARWSGPAADDKDTVAYRVSWSQTTAQGILSNEERLIAVSSPELRIGGLVNDLPVDVTIVALDASDNSSTSTVSVSATPTGDAVPIPFRPLDVKATNITGSSAVISWTRNSAGPEPASYQVTYKRQTDNIVPQQMDVTTTSAILSGLQTGAVYDVTIQALNANGWRSASSDHVRLTVTDGVDNDGDGLPDDWETAYGVSGAMSDPDGDGLTNADEFAFGTDPAYQDSDGDGWSDWEERSLRTDPLDSSSYGAQYLQPRLQLERKNLRFDAASDPGSAQNMQHISWSNSGGGTLNISASPSASWIKVAVNGNTLDIQTDTSGLTPGFYSGIVRVVQGDNSDPLIGSPSCIRVNAKVSAPIGGYKTYLPLVEKENRSISSTHLPDLIGSISISPTKTDFKAGEPVLITATITNTGEAPAAPFWVDLYINPSSPPEQANQVWYDRCSMSPCYGIAWYVNHTLAPGEGITLTSTPSSYSSGHTIWPGFFINGTSDLYLYVDSWNPGVPNGAAAESNESNNRAELHGLHVTGNNPSGVKLPSITNMQERSLP